MYSFEARLPRQAICGPLLQKNVRLSYVKNDFDCGRRAYFAEIMKDYLLNEGYEVLERVTGSKRCRYFMSRSGLDYFGYHAAGVGRMVGVPAYSQVVERSDYYADGARG